MKTAEEKYVESPYHCPVCESPNISAQRAEQADDSVWVPVECDDCGSLWNELYQLVEIEMVDREEED